MRLCLLVLNACRLRQPPWLCYYFEHLPARDERTLVTQVLHLVVKQQLGLAALRVQIQVRHGGVVVQKPRGWVGAQQLTQDHPQEITVEHKANIDFSTRTGGLRSQPLAYRRSAFLRLRVGLSPAFSIPARFTRRE